MTSPSAGSPKQCPEAGELVLAAGGRTGDSDTDADQTGAPMRHRPASAKRTRREGRRGGGEYGKHAGQAARHHEPTPGAGPGVQHRHLPAKPRSPPGPGVTSGGVVLLLSSASPSKWRGSQTK